MRLPIEPNQEPGRPQGTSVTPTLSFFNLPLPRELICQVLQNWIPSECLIVEEEHATPHCTPNTCSTFRVTYDCSADSGANTPRTLPADLRREYWRIRQLSYLRSAKVFRTPYDFYMSHYLLSLDPHTKLPPYTAVPPSLSQTHRTVAIQPLICLPHPHLSFHGLETVELDFDASQYFAFFNVRLPPFNTTDTASQGDELYPDPHLHGAAMLLQHCRHLVLHFDDAYGYAHPWFSVKDSTWADACLRPRVCERGLVIDWILEYAWHGAFLQHLERFEMRGDVQQWVRAKWTAIFDNPDRTGHESDTEAIEQFGLVPGEEERWRAVDHFPPACKCEVGCWALRGGEVVEDVQECVWDESEEVGVVGDWDDVVY
ncbi:hypothetical protein CC86DRAFT_402415 [Ophiobolus disseminans]|uniref:Uncharacterized protein n=1 Tax=Ophiobolus disseminans TaxID=1469910 RepID=A0A6A7AAP4_9PLEO|nr:hypothetical protein CC86DRAFT_402415 [Ophiobolus disseminans]